MIAKPHQYNPEPRSPIGWPPCGSCAQTPAYRAHQPLWWRWLHPKVKWRWQE